MNIAVWTHGSTLADRVVQRLRDHGDGDLGTEAVGECGRLGTDDPHGCLFPAGDRHPLGINDPRRDEPGHCCICTLGTDPDGRPLCDDPSHVSLGELVEAGELDPVLAERVNVDRSRKGEPATLY